ncbi:MAG: FAD:protein FMN transferase [Nitrobacter sp.]
MMASADRRVAIPVALTMPRAAPAGGQLQQLAGAIMGTTWSVKFVGSRVSTVTLQRAIDASLQRVLSQMSPWESQSDMSRFNRLRPGDWQTLPPEFLQVIDAALRIARQSDGAYDPTMGALVDLWGFGPSGRRASPPPPAALMQCHGVSSWRELELDVAQHRLRRHTPAQLDLCGIAKGFAVDLLMATLREHGIHHALIEIGGELLGRGIKPDGSPWWVEIDRPEAGFGSHTTAAPLLVALHDLAIATSGRERGFTSERRSFSHTIDPRTGSPIDNSMVTATMLHATCMEADAYATALMVMGPDAAIDFATKQQLAAVITFVNEDGRLCERTTPALDAMLS